MKKILEIIAVTIGFSIGVYFSALGFNVEPEYKLLVGLIVGYLFCSILKD